MTPWPEIVIVPICVCFGALCIMSSSGGISPDGKVYCKHMEEAAKRKSSTSKHPNRCANLQYCVC